MLNKLRNFSKSRIAIVLVAIIIIPFVFWGMGSVFSGGNTNSVVKINNHNISTQEFIDYLNNTKIDSTTIKKNIENNILEQLLSRYISNKIIEIEIEELNINISDNALAKKIKSLTLFKDNDNNFSRTKYEKFLLENNLSVSQYEENIKRNELRKILFSYIGGGLNTPYFMTNEIYKKESKRIEIEHFKLNHLYKDIDNLTINDVSKFLNENSDEYKIDMINVSFAKITPEILIGESDFTDKFFNLIDEIENMVLDKIEITEISKKFNFTLEQIENYNPKFNSDKSLKKVYENKESKKYDILDNNEFFLLYNINNISKKIPNIKNEIFLNETKQQIINKDKFNKNREIIEKIENNLFTYDQFVKLSDNNINKNILGPNENEKIFTNESIEFLNSKKKNSYSIVTDDDDNIYLVKIINIFEKDLNKENKEFITYQKSSDSKIRENLYYSYDNILNNKYEIKINQKTLDKIKNYFR